MAWTPAQLAALEAAIATGTKRVAYSDKTMEYHSMTEMLELRAQMKAEIEVSAGTDRHARVAFSRD